jgi:hypothetical protein
VKRIRGKKQPLTAAPTACVFCFLLSQFQLFSMPAPALAAETLTLKRALSDLVNQADALTPAEIALMWQCACPPPLSAWARIRLCLLAANLLPACVPLLPKRHPPGPRPPKKTARIPGSHSGTPLPISRRAW